SGGGGHDGAVVLAQYRRLTPDAGPGGGAPRSHRRVPAEGEGAGCTPGARGDSRELQRSLRWGARHPPGPDVNRWHVVVAEQPRRRKNMLVGCSEERLLDPNLLTQSTGSRILYNWK